ncbi:MAG TPA: ISL3 family transposase [Chloroflexota bacterium]|nr:ISL3 family transposase [Chloroflexota bacterium]
MALAAPGLVVRGVRVEDGTVVLDAEGAGSGARCPACGELSDRVHGRYRRRPLDLPWRGQVVRLALTVRRFACANHACHRRTFAETVGDALPTRARRTVPTDAALLAVARALGGRAGARLAASAGLPVSRDTLLRLLRRSVGAVGAAPRVLGVDDLATRKGHRYATILVDLETHRPIDLLDGREAGTLRSWLAAHPGVEVVVRDRAGAYAEGAAAGAPDALQVADRFHLVKNAGEAMVDLLQGRRRTVDALAVDAAPPVADSTGAEHPPPVSARALSPSAQRTADRRAARVARWEEVRARHAAGETLRGIARAMHLARETVRRLARTPLPPKNQRTAPPRPPPLASATLAPHVTDLQDRWQAGCQNTALLFREIAAQGYAGSYSLLNQALRPWRPPRPPSEEHPVPGRPRRRHWRYRVRRLCLTPPARLTAAEHEALDRLLADDPVLADGHALLQRFRALVAGRDAGALDDWLADARASDLPGFVALANSIAADRAAVDGALTTAWSTGPVEGLVHKAKLIKRQGYGRAKLDLLRARILAA